MANEVTSSDSCCEKSALLDVLPATSRKPGSPTRASSWSSFRTMRITQVCGSRFFPCEGEHKKAKMGLLKTRFVSSGEPRKGKHRLPSRIQIIPAVSKRCDPIARSTRQSAHLNPPDDDPDTIRLTEMAQRDEEQAQALRQKSRECRDQARGLRSNFRPILPDDAG